MRWQWLFGNFADPEHGLSRKDGHALSDRAHREHMPGKTFVFWTVLLIVGPLLILFAVVLPVVLRSLGRSGQNGPYLIGVAIIVVFAWPWSAWVYGHLYAKAVRRAMRAEGREVCLECGHALENLPAEIERCPECGHPRNTTYEESFVRYKTLFRVLLKVIGVWLFANGMINLFAAFAQFLTFQVSGGFTGAGGPMPWWVIAGGAAPFISFGIGLYLFFGGEKIVNLAIPSNRPYCPDCGYDLTTNHGDRCPECGATPPTNTVPVSGSRAAPPDIL